jgi:hypothetical protein
VIRRRDGCWQVRVYAGLDPLTRKLRYEYERAATRKQAEQAEARLLAEIADGHRKGAEARTVADLLDRWLALARSGGLLHLIDGWACRSRAQPRDSDRRGQLVERDDNS